MYLKATRLERGLYKVIYPPDYNPDDAILLLGNMVGNVLLPDGYKEDSRQGNQVCYRIDESVVSKLLDGGLCSVWAAVPTPFLIQEVKKLGSSRPSPRIKA